MKFFAQILNKVSVALIVNKTLKIARKKYKDIMYKSVQFQIRNW